MNVLLRGLGVVAQIYATLFAPTARWISLKGPVRSWYYYISNEPEWVQLSMWPSGITLALYDEGYWLDLWAMLRNRLPLVSYFLPKTMRQASKDVLPMVYLFCLNYGGQKGAAAGSILHRERPILRRAYCALCCLMYLRGLRHGGTIGSNQGSQRGHGHGRMEAAHMVLAFCRFAR